MSEYFDDPREDLPHRLLLTLGVSVVAGLLIAGALLPLVGGLGLVTRAGAETFSKLPKELETPPLPERSVVKYADGTTMATLFFNQNRVVVPIHQIPEHMQLAILAIEDERFYQHPGVDWRGLLRALASNTRSGGVTQGGSTITQQYVKNVLIETAQDKAGVDRATERSTARKLREARYALALEKRFTKREILERYLNIAYFGQGVYGVGTAATHYFNRDIRRPEPDKGITLDQAALLAGMVQNPTTYDPTKNPLNAERRRNLVLANMLKLGFITQFEHDEAVAQPVHTVAPRKLTNECGETQDPWFCDYLREWLLNNPKLGADRTQRATRVFQGGLTITTTLDRRIQDAAKASIAKHIHAENKDRAAAVAVVVRPGTGEVLALTSNQVFGKGDGETEINHATNRNGYQAGSTWKVFVLAAAIDQGIPLGKTFNSPGRLIIPPDPRLNISDPYPVSNYGGSSFGSINMLRATANSVNTYYIQLARETGLDAPIEMARKLGVEIPADKALAHKFASLPLGVMAVSPIEMAEAYATLAARGLHCGAIPIARIVDRQNRVLDQLDPASQCTQVIEASKADTINYVLEGVVRGGTGRPAAIGRPAAGKTGTSQNNRTAWFCGYTPDLAAVTMLGHPKNANLPQNWLANFQGSRGVTGGSFPAAMWRDLMRPAHEGLPPRGFVPPVAGGFLQDGDPVPSVIGLSVEEARAALDDAGFTMAIGLGTVPRGPIPAGFVGEQIPGPGSSATAGTVVTIYLSDGNFPPASGAPTAQPLPSGTGSPTTPPSESPTPTTSPSPTSSPSPTPSETTGRPRPGRSTTPPSDPDG